MVLKPGEELSIREFVEGIVHDGPVKIGLLCELRSARGAHTKSTLKRQKGQESILIAEEVPPTPGFVQREAIRLEIVDALRTKLGTQEFSAEGRISSGFDRVTIAPREWAELQINVDNWTVGVGNRQLTDLRVRRGGSLSEDERLYGLVQALLAELPPRSRIVKGTIKAISETVSNFNVTEKMFLRAWERATEELPADLKEAWTRSGL